MSYSNFNMRLDDGLKASVMPVFERYGLTPSQAVKLFFNQVANTQKIPLSFDWATQDSEEFVPNAKTRQAILDARQEYLADKTRYDSVDEALKEMERLAHG